ncbi:MAG: beta-propeller domain-containing protein [Archaeoglobaceae archaeon]
MRKTKFVIVFIAIVMLATLVQISVRKSEVEDLNIKGFSSPQEFRDYVIGNYPEVTISERVQTLLSSNLPEQFSSPKLEIGGGSEIERFSTTNVQVLGVDEPDIVKTDGEKLYISRKAYPIAKILPPLHFKTIVLKIFPPNEIEKLAEINVSGDLLLYSDVLILLTSDHLKGFDTKSFGEIYSIELNGSLVTARMYKGKIYVITSQYFETCPIIPLKVDGKDFVVECGRIYHPIKPIPVETIYTVAKINAKTGEVEKIISFVGNHNSVVYMSENAVYVTYYSRMPYSEVFIKFVAENGDLFPSWFVERLNKIVTYDISEQAKHIEIWDSIRKLMLTMKPEDRVVFENELYNRLNNFMEKKAREIERTKIWKISSEMEIVANGEIPGRLLNQFSMDEYKDFLRIAVSVGNSNDLYILDSNLKTVGSLKGFGEMERIFGVRFIGERGYIVTFRQIDPFFIIDLSDPKKPEIVGELKIPGYSSYLHPIGEKLVLGIGMENSSVKISLFDVSNPKKPEELSKFVLKEHWSEVINNHRAFLIDEKHKVFFLPASRGYVFSYEPELKLIKATETGFRAIFINDYLYIIGKKLVVFDENTWEKVAEVDISLL